MHRLKKGIWVNNMVEKITDEELELYAQKVRDDIKSNAESKVAISSLYNLLILPLCK